MHDCDLDAATCSLNLAFNLSVRHLWEYLSDPLDGLLYRHVALGNSLENVTLVLRRPIVDVPHSKLDAREPVSDATQSLHHPILLLWLPSHPFTLSDLRLGIFPKWNAKDDPSSLLGPSLSLPLLVSLPLVRPSSSRS